MQMRCFMRNEVGTRRNVLKGYMFETIIKQLLRQNGFGLIDRFDGDRIRKQRQYFVEIRGRGTWHQIDCPFDYTNFIPFMYPIRLLGEVKFYTSPVSKQHIREYIGVIKDIQENYFVPDRYDGPFQRVTEIGVFFSANGFDEEADKLAFVHNIKNVSYKNNYLIEPIKQCIEELERNYFSVRVCISEGNVAAFITLLEEILGGNDNSVEEFKRKFNPADGFERLLFNLRELISCIKSNFVVTTSGGIFIHFIGESVFPNEIFEETDEQKVQVFVKQTQFGDAYYLIFENDSTKREFYFTPPLSLKQAVYYGNRNDILDQKEELFRSLHTTITINGITRNLIFKLDTDWLDAQRNDDECE